MKLFTCFVVAFLFSQSCFAGVVLGSTRLIYNSDEKEATLTLTNTREAKSYLVQSWVSSSGSNKENVPFIVTPPVFKLGGGKKGMLRVLYTDNSLPRDRESLFWLNVKPIPAQDIEAQNELQVVIKSKIKLLYRPDSLRDDAPQAYKKLRFSKIPDGMDIYNPTPYYISLYSLMLNGKEDSQISMLPPFSHNKLKTIAGNLNTSQWQAINDNGSPSEIMKATF
ncbi:TPA: molecular chaperone [Klebsiella oxytoca]|nr:molecular chaperone [Klebsiella oxytoca]